MGFTKYSEGHVRHVLDDNEENANTRRVSRLVDGRCPECGGPLMTEIGTHSFCPECEIPAPPASETN